MENSRKIHVLNEFKFSLGFLTAYNENIFRHSDWLRNLRSAGIAVYTTMLYVSHSTLIVLSIWYLIESEFELGKFLAVAAILISLFQMDLVIIALLMKNRVIVETINQLQKVVNQRKSTLFR